MKSDLSIVYYDGVCGLCNRAVQFILKKDHRAVFRFAALQSVYAANHLPLKSLPDSIVLSYNGKLYVRSDAALKIFMLLGGLWKIAAIGYLIPAFIRDRIYNWIASNRYQWFGKYPTCPIPSPEVKALFIDE